MRLFPSLNPAFSCKGKLHRRLTGCTHLQLSLFITITAVLWGVPRRVDSESCCETPPLTPNGLNSKRQGLPPRCLQGRCGCVGLWKVLVIFSPVSIRIPPVIDHFLSRASALMALFSSPRRQMFTSGGSPPMRGRRCPLMLVCLVVFIELSVWT